ncbi:MAG: hypothetical protein ABSC06_23515 [Rhodopila sp.]
MNKVGLRETKEVIDPVNGQEYTVDVNTDRVVVRDNDTGTAIESGSPTENVGIALDESRRWIESHEPQPDEGHAFGGFNKNGEWVDGREADDIDAPDPEYGAIVAAAERREAAREAEVDIAPYYGLDEQALADAREYFHGPHKKAEQEHDSETMTNEPIKTTEYFVEVPDSRGPDARHVELLRAAIWGGLGELSNGEPGAAYETLSMAYEGSKALSQEHDREDDELALGR